jgi:hypothetical protein
LIKSSKTKYSNKKFVKNSLETKFENKNFHEKSSGKIIEKNFNGGPPAGELFGLPPGAVVLHYGSGSPPSGLGNHQEQLDEACTLRSLSGSSRRSLLGARLRRDLPGGALRGAPPPGSARRSSSGGRHCRDLVRTMVFLPHACRSWSF